MLWKRSQFKTSRRATTHGRTTGNGVLMVKDVILKNIKCVWTYLQLNEFSRASLITFWTYLVLSITLHSHKPLYIWHTTHRAITQKSSMISAGWGTSGAVTSATVITLLRAFSSRVATRSRNASFSSCRRFILWASSSKLISTGSGMHCTTYQ